MKPIEWRVEDFYGRYHGHRIKNDLPVPGTALRAETAKTDAQRARKANLQSRLDAIEERRRAAAAARGRAAAVRGVLEVERVVEGVARRVDGKLAARQGAVKSLVVDTEGHLAEGKRAKAFMGAVLGNETEKVAFMLKQGYRGALDATEPGYHDSALMAAARRGNAEIVQLLLESGANPNLVNTFGEAAVNLAYRHWDAAPDLTAAAAADPAALRAARERSAALLELLLAHGADPNHAEANGFTPLHEASRLGPLAAVLLLLKYKANAKAVDFRGRTPLDYAEEGGLAETRRVLRQWALVEPTLAPEEFRTKWQAFMKDPGVRMGAAPTAEESLQAQRRAQAGQRELKARRGGAGKFGVVDRPTTAALAENVRDQRARTARLLGAAHYDEGAAESSTLTGEDDQSESQSGTLGLTAPQDHATLATFGPDSFLSLPSRAGTAQGWRERGQRPRPATSSGPPAAAAAAAAPPSRVRWDPPPPRPKTQQAAKKAAAPWGRVTLPNGLVVGAGAAEGPAALGGGGDPRAVTPAGRLGLGPEAAARRDLLLTPGEAPRGATAPGFRGHGVGLLSPDSSTVTADGFAATKSEVRITSMYPVDEDRPSEGGGGGGGTGWPALAPAAAAAADGAGQGVLERRAAAAADPRLLYYAKVDAKMRLASDRPLQVPLDDYLAGAAPPGFLERRQLKRVDRAQASASIAIKSDLSYLKKTASLSAFSSTTPPPQQPQGAGGALGRRRAARAGAVLGDARAGPRALRPATAGPLFQGRRAANPTRPHAEGPAAKFTCDAQGRPRPTATYPDNLYGARLVNPKKPNEQMDEFFAADDDKSIRSEQTWLTKQQEERAFKPEALRYNPKDTLPIPASTGGHFSETIAGNRGRPIELHQSDPESKKTFNPRPKTRQPFSGDPWKETDGMKIVTTF